MPKAYRIKDWNRHFENNRTRDLISMPWIPVTTRQDGFSYVRLVDDPNGAAHLGVWLALLQTAAKCTPRGLLIRSDGKPHDFTTLHQVSRLPIADITEAIPRLLDIGWLEACDVDPCASPPSGGAVSLRDDCGAPASAAHYSRVEESTAAGCGAPSPHTAAAAAVLGLGRFTERQAAKLLADCGVEAVVHGVKRYIAERDKPGGDGIRNPIAFLTKVCRDGSTPPDPKRTRSHGAEARPRPIEFAPTIPSPALSQNTRKAGSV